MEGARVCGGYGVSGSATGATCCDGNGEWGDTAPVRCGAGPGHCEARHHCPGAAVRGLQPAVHRPHRHVVVPAVARREVPVLHRVRAHGARAGADAPPHPARGRSGRRARHLGGAHELPQRDSARATRPPGAAVAAATLTHSPNR
jgi:hypothetical protein